MFLSVIVTRFNKGDNGINKGNVVSMKTIETRSVGKN